MNKHHIFIATPMYGGMCAGYYTQAMLTLQNQAQQAGVTVTYSFMFNESLITRARNALVHNFLKSEATHMMFIDADVSFKPEHVFSLIEENKDLIAGNYPKKMIDWEDRARAYGE